MKATIESTDLIVPVSDPNGRHARARVWEGVSESGVPFVAYITMVQVRSNEQAREFERDLNEHKPPSPATLRAIDLRFIL